MTKEQALYVLRNTAWLGTVEDLQDVQRALETIETAVGTAERLNEWCTDCREYDSEHHCCPRFNRVIRGAVEEVRGQGSETGERKKGKWLSDNRPGGGFWVCSCCKFPSEAFAANVLYKYCPNCGAKMEGTDEAD